jgi:hypothetical protein
MVGFEKFSVALNNGRVVGPARTICWNTARALSVSTTRGPGGETAVTETTRLVILSRGRP